MYIIKLFLYHLLIKGITTEFQWDIAFEKIEMQFRGAVNYLLNTEEKRPIALDVSFNLYTRRHPQVPQVLPLNYPSIIRMSDFNPTLRTYFIIHGYTDCKDRDYIAALRMSLNAAEDCNVIVVDWSRLASHIYITVINFTTPVGNYLGQFLQFLELNQLDLQNVQLIGHSLGAHIAGVAGAFVKGKIGRITGLDPAGPYYELLEERPASDCIDKSDALFVDIIHTDGDEFGIARPVGHADFYPNEGTSPQPGCNSLLISVSCSHVRSVEFYTESVTNKYLFEARHCNLTTTDADCLQEDPVMMGHFLSPDAKGVYFLETNPTPPFAKKIKTV